MLTTDFKKIEKELIADLKFPAEEVLMSEDAKKERLYYLERAMSLGNLEHSKCKIFFEDDTCVRMVETTVWGVTDKRVILKQGMVIPIHRIHSVQL